MKVTRATRTIAHTCIDCGNRRTQEAYLFTPEVVDECNNFVLCRECTTRLVGSIIDRLKATDKETGMQK